MSTPVIPAGAKVLGTIQRLSEGVWIATYGTSSSKHLNEGSARRMFLNSQGQNGSRNMRFVENQAPGLQPSFLVYVYPV